MNAKNAGRKRVTFVTSWGETIPGLTRQKDKRWRILGTHIRFAEADERQAVAKYRRLTSHTGQTLDISAKIGKANRPEETLKALANAAQAAGPDSLFKSGLIADNISVDGDDLIAGQQIDPLILFGWLREKLLIDPKYIADRVGIPELAALKSFDIPLAPVKLSAILDIFKAKKKFSQKLDLGRHAAAWKAMIKTASAETISELTVERLKLWRDQVRKHYATKSQANLFGRVRAIASFVSREEALHVASLTPLLARMEILKPAGHAPADDPQPMEPQTFKKLVQQAETEGDTRMVAALWMSLNFAMYSEEVTRLKWSEINLANATMFTRRDKTGQCVRAATVWPETIAALSKIEKIGSAFPILMSREGTAVSAHQLRKQYFSLRKRAKVELTKATQWASLRDGAYTAACHDPKVEERFARILAGHRAPGVADKYVARNPQIVRPACDAVRFAYLGLKPVKKTKAA
jgi:integrase